MGFATAALLALVLLPAGNATAAVTCGGKAATIMQFLAIGSLVMGWPAAVPFAWGAFGLGLTALIDYIRRAITIGQKRLADTHEGKPK